MGRGVIREGGGLFHFFTQKGGLLERGAYLTEGGLNREITVTSHPALSP